MVKLTSVIGSKVDNEFFLYMDHGSVKIGYKIGEDLFALVKALAHFQVEVTLD